ncbi:MAG: GDSL-type esterase/lipase family protein, partial [Rubripirellula sp.]
MVQQSDVENLFEALNELKRMYRMSVTGLCWLCFWLSQVAAISFPKAVEDAKPRLVLIGDSTVKNGSGKGDSGLYGWGQVLNRHFDLARIEIENRALGGRSSRSYLTEGLWQKSLDRVRPGDFVLMQFGHNDGGQMFDGDRPRASIKGNSDEAIDGVV